MSTLPILNTQRRGQRIGLVVASSACLFAAFIGLGTAALGEWVPVLIVLGVGFRALAYLAPDRWLPRARLGV